MLPRYARCVLSRLGGNGTAFFLVLISLDLPESRILSVAPVDTRPKTPIISFCTVQLRTLCAAHSLAIFYLSTTSGPGPEELHGFWGSMVFWHTLNPRKGSGNQQQLGKRAMPMTLSIVVNVMMSNFQCYE